MNKTKVCKFCKGRLEKREWIQTVEEGKCPKGTYEYYACIICGFRYTSEEVENEKSQPVTA